MAAIEMAEAKTESVTYMGCTFNLSSKSRQMFTTSYGLASTDLAALGLQEMIRYFWFDIKELGVLSMLSFRICQAAKNGRAWRKAVRTIFPHHPFEVYIC